MHTIQHIESEESRPNFSYGRKLTEEQLTTIWIICKQDRGQTSQQVITDARTKYGLVLNVSIRQLNWWRREWDLNRPKGRPRQESQQLQHSHISTVIPVQFNISHVGLHLFILWLEGLSLFGQLTDALQQAISIHIQAFPDDSFPLLYHRPQTLLKRFLALLLAPLFGIKKLTEYDIVQHSLKSLIGRSFLSSTLNQFLGQLERVNASTYLMPLLYSENKGSLAYIDGHMIPFWTSQKMHKGLITMLGRVMAGSNAVVTHNEHGYPLYFKFYAPDYRMPPFILDYCQNIVSSTGIKLFIIDREVNSLQIAQAFESLDWGLLCMLDKNEYDDFESFLYELIVDEEYPIYRAKWKSKEKQEKDPRHFVLMKKDGKVLAYWGTSRFKEKIKEQDWPKLYSNRNEVQENGFKRMIANCALNTNYGIKKIEGPDRHQERRKEKLKEKREKASVRWEKIKGEIEQQKEKVEESQKKEHGNRLKQRQTKLTKLEYEEKVKKKKIELLQDKLEQEGEDKRRSDRDFRKQNVMTFRTLFLDKLLLMFFAWVMEPLDEKASMDRLLELFRRSGAYAEKELSYEYWIYSNGMSKSNQRLLKKVIERVNKMELVKQGKPVIVRLREEPD